MHEVKNEHEMHETIEIDVYYPDHPPRKESALFTKTKHHLIKVLDIPCQVCGTKEKREVHHFHAEWADSEGIDFEGKMRELHPSFDWSTYTEPSDFIDSEYNMMVLCLAPETKVMMGDGSQKPISNIVIGDEVIGHDGESHRVTDTNTVESGGKIYNVDGIRASGNHPFLTPEGWVNAEDLSVGQIVYQFGMGFSQMLRLRRIKNKIFNAIISLVPINMMHALLFGKCSSNAAFHNVPMFHNEATGTRAIADEHPDVAFSANANTGDFFEWPRCAIQTGKPTFVGAESLAFPSSLPCKHGHLLSAVFAIFHNFFLANRLSANGGALCRTSAVSSFNSSRNKKFSLANLADFLNARFYLRTGWRPVNHVAVSHYDGKLYDITVEGSHSFLANRIAVHNCEKHHRAKGHGIHWIPYPIWVMQQIQKKEFIFSPDEVST